MCRMRRRCINWTRVLAGSVDRFVRDGGELQGLVSAGSACDNIAAVKSIAGKAGTIADRYELGVDV